MSGPVGPFGAVLYVQFNQLSLLSTVFCTGVYLSQFYCSGAGRNFALNHLSVCCSLLDFVVFCAYFSNVGHRNGSAFCFLGFRPF